jgi:hypothetical protein
MVVDDKVANDEDLIPDEGEMNTLIGIILSEKARSDAEAVRASNEAARKESESIRASNEAARNRAEEGRAAEEIKRINNEANRGSAFTASQSERSAEFDASQSERSAEFDASQSERSAEFDAFISRSNAMFQSIIKQFNGDLNLDAARIVGIPLPAAGWQGETNPYWQVATIEGISPFSKVDLQPSPEQLAIFHNKDLAFVTENEDGVVTVYAIGDKPTQDYTIQATVTEVAI